MPTQIANPIYDVVFKYLMKDNRIAKMIISSIIGAEVLTLELRPQETTVSREEALNEIGDAQKREQIRKQWENRKFMFSLVRLDFSAKIKTASGEVKNVLIELQKTKTPGTLMRFRRYLGENYSRKEYDQDGNVIAEGLSILPIYLLGFKLYEVSAPIIKIDRCQLDAYNNTVITSKNVYVENLTHDAFFVQIPYLTGRYRNEAEQLLSVFDQSKRGDNHHILTIDESAYSPKHRAIIRTLQKAIADPEVIRKMDIEDELEVNERELVKSVEGLAVAREELAKKDEELAKKDEELAKKDEELSQLKTQMGDILKRLEMLER